MKKEKQKIYQKLYHQNKWKNDLIYKTKRRNYNTNYIRKKRGGLKRIKNEYTGLNPRDRLRAIRITVLQHYGGLPPKCNCCGEKEIKFLAIDHINGSGNTHRKTITKTGKGGNMSFWLLKNGLPNGFQVLCHNCNMAKGFYGICPHKQKVV